MPMEKGMSIEMGKGMTMSDHRGGHLYMQTNEVKNAIIHYHRSANGTLTEVERVATAGAGSGTFKPISGQESSPNAFEGAGSVILSADRRLLFTTNGGDNSVSSFAIGDDGRLTLLDVCPTGNPVEGRSGTAKSLAYAPETGTLYALHSLGHDPLRRRRGQAHRAAGAVHRQRVRQAQPHVHDGRDHAERPLRLRRHDVRRAR